MKIGEIGIFIGFMVLANVTSRSDKKWLTMINKSLLAAILLEIIRYIFLLA